MLTLLSPQIMLVMMKNQRPIMMTMMTMAMMTMTVLTYNVDLHITLLGPRRKHLKGGRLPRVEVTNLQQKDGESVFCIKIAHRVPDKLALVRCALVRRQLGRRWCWGGFGWR